MNMKIFDETSYQNGYLSGHFYAMELDLVKTFE